MEYGDGIKLGSEDSIVTKFKGNMFKIDENGHVYTSVFYDNVAYGEAELEAGYFQGGYVLTSSIKDVEYNKLNGELQFLIQEEILKNEIPEIKEVKKTYNGALRNGKEVSR